MATQKILIIDPAINRPKQLTPNTTSAGAADAGKITALNASGVLDSTLFPAGIGNSSTSVTSAENLAASAMVNIDSTGKARNANATDATKPATAFVTAAVTAPAAATVFFSGQIVTGVAGLTQGAPVYLSASTAGGVTSTAPAATGNLLQQLSPAALSATSFVFQPDAGIIL